VLGFRTPHPLPFGCPEGMFELPCCHQCRWNSTVMSRRATHNPKVGGSNPPPQPKLLHFQSYKDSAASTALSVISSGHRKHCVRWLATGCSGKTRKSSRSLPQRIWSSDIYVIRDRSIPVPTLRIKADAHCQSFHLLRWALNQHSGIGCNHEPVTLRFRSQECWRSRHADRPFGQGAARNHFVIVGTPTR
jgi:hypothetical protein